MNATKAVYSMAVFLVSTMPISFSYAADWFYVNEGQDYKYYVDISSIEKSGDIISAWFKMSLKKKARPDIIKGKALHESKFKYETKYSTHEGRTTNSVYYSYRGDVIYSDASYRVFEETIPETLGEGWSGFLINLYKPLPSDVTGVPAEPPVPDMAQ